MFQTRRYPKFWLGLAAALLVPMLVVPTLLAVAQRTKDTNGHTDQLEHFAADSVVQIRPASLPADQQVRKRVAIAKPQKTLARNESKDAPVFARLPLTPMERRRHATRIRNSHFGSKPNVGEQVKPSEQVAGSENKNETDFQPASTTEESTATIRLTPPATPSVNENANQKPPIATEKPQQQQQLQLKPKAPQYENNAIEPQQKTQQKSEDGHEIEDSWVKSDSWVSTASATVPTSTQPKTVTSAKPSNDFRPTAKTERSSVFQPVGINDDLIWWNGLIDQPLEKVERVETATVDELLKLALLSSPQIAAISQDPLIREAQIIEADAEFDPVIFTRNLFEDRTDPVGNTLTTGGAPFLEDHVFNSDTGIRRKLRRGADLEVTQNLGFQNSNSTFFVPQDQGTATLAINLSQPLLRGAGEYFNRLQILIAQSAGEVAWEVFSSELQDELQRVLSSYWQLYFDRSNYLQLQRNVLRGEQILETLEQRAGLDSLPSQIARARSAVQARKTDLANALRDIRNAETNIRRLIGDDQWLIKQSVEILPIERPIEHELKIPLKQIVQLALENRPEIRESAKRTKIAAFQMNISENELLPDLTWLVGASFSGLEGGTGVERAFVEQFSTTTPSYSLGLEFEVPYRNRAAKSRLTQSRIQLNKLQSELKETMQRVVAESQIAYRRVESALQTLTAAKVSIEAASQDLRQQERRFETFALIEGDLADGQSPTSVLDQLLDSQERLTSAESVYAQAVLEFQVASIALNRATGTLLMHEQVSYDRTEQDGVPAVKLHQVEEAVFDQPAEIEEDE